MLPERGPPLYNAESLSLSSQASLGSGRGKGKLEPAGSRKEGGRDVFCSVLLNFIIAFRGTAVILVEFKVTGERKSGLLLQVASLLCSSS